jgi:hypothetical protein
VLHGLAEKVLLVGAAWRPRLSGMLACTIPFLSITTMPQLNIISKMGRRSSSG